VAWQHVGELRMQVLHWRSLHASRTARCAGRFELHAGSIGVGLSWKEVWMVMSVLAIGEI
jgi:hypothetical protein